MEALPESEGPRSEGFTGPPLQPETGHPKPLGFTTPNPKPSTLMQDLVLVRLACLMRSLAVR